MKFISPKSYLASIRRIAHATVSRDGPELLDKNERTVDFPPAVLEELHRRITPFLLRAYPEPEPLVRKLSAWLESNPSIEAKDPSKVRKSVEKFDLSFAARRWAILDAERAHPSPAPVAPPTEPGRALPPPPQPMAPGRAAEPPTPAERRDR